MYKPKMEPVIILTWTKLSVCVILHAKIHTHLIDFNVRFNETMCLYVICNRDIPRVCISNYENLIWFIQVWNKTRYAWLIGYMFIWVRRSKFSNLTDQIWVQLNAGLQGIFPKNIIAKFWKSFIKGKMMNHPHKWTVVLFPMSFESSLHSYFPYVQEEEMAADRRVRYVLIQHGKFTSSVIGSTLNFKSP